MDIINKNNDTLISGTSEKDSINNYGSNVTILAADGRDTINNFGSNVIANCDEGNDYIQNDAENVTINGGDGKDQIRNGSSYVMINGDADTDYLWTQYVAYNSDIFADLIEGVTLNGGAGDDTIGCESGNRNLFIGGDGDDAIVSGDSSKKSYNTTIFAGDGNDTIRTFGEHELIYGEAGNDLLGHYYGNGNYPTIVGGAGDDTINLQGRNNNEYFIEYTEGDGNDVVVPSNKSSTINLSILKGNHTVYKDGGDLLVIVGDGSIRFLGMAGKSININGTPIIAETSAPSTTTQNLIPISATTSTTTNNSGGTTIINGPVYINNTTINNTTINETNINYITSVNNTYIYNGGDKVINNYVEGQAVQLTSDYQGIDFNGNSFFVNSSSGQLEIQNSRDKFIGYSGHDNNVVAYSYWASGGGQIDGRGKNQTEILIGGDNANNQIFAGSGGSSMWGGNGGNDMLIGGDGYDEFFYAVGSENDVIKNAGDNDVVNLLGVSLSQILSFSYDNSSVDLIFNDGGNLKVESTSSVGYRVENQTYTFSHTTGQWSTK